jgi:hypothetical protein
MALIPSFDTLSLYRAPFPDAGQCYASDDRLKDLATFGLPVRAHSSATAQPVSCWGPIQVSSFTKSLLVAPPILEACDYSDTLFIHLIQCPLYRQCHPLIDRSKHQPKSFLSFPSRVSFFGSDASFNVPFLDAGRAPVSPGRSIAQALPCFFPLWALFSGSLSLSCLQIYIVSGFSTFPDAGGAVAPPG